MSSAFPESPFEFFDLCFKKAEALQLPQVNAMVLITATKDAKPSGRMVLLKSVIPDRGFQFFTNYDSRKGRELSENPLAELLFYWPALGRQIRVEGRVERTSAIESDAYFKSRARMSQIGAMASLQSRPLGSEEELRAKVEKLSQEFAEKEISRPVNWGGFDFIADRFEFWGDREDRLHERMTYVKTGVSWELGRLWP